MIKTVIFDMDGVIIDSEPIHFEIEEEIFHELEISVPLTEHYSYVGTSAQNMWDAIIKKYGLKEVPDRLIRMARTRYLEYLANAEDLAPIEGVRELIQELYESHFNILVASSSHREVIDLVLTKFALSEYIIAKVSGAELAYSKPHPEIFIRSASMVRCERDCCLVIEDSENGVRAAKAASMNCIGFLNPNSGVQNLSSADLVIQSFKEINVEKIRYFGNGRSI